MTKSALGINDKLLSTPIFSTTLSVSRIPAVSIISNATPEIVIEPSTKSRVVPAISVVLTSDLKYYSCRHSDVQQ